MDDNNNIYITTSNFNKDERIYDVFIRKFNADGTIDTSFGLTESHSRHRSLTKVLLQKVLL
jgi:hypothetical protein